MKDTLRDVWESLKDFFTRDWTLTEKLLMILCCVLFGIIYGFMLAPVKRGVKCFSDNGNTYNQMEDDFWLDEED